MPFGGNPTFDPPRRVRLSQDLGDQLPRGLLGWAVGEVAAGTLVNFDNGVSATVLYLVLEPVDEEDRRQLIEQLQTAIGRLRNDHGLRIKDLDAYLGRPFNDDRIVSVETT